LFSLDRNFNFWARNPSRVL